MLRFLVVMVVLVMVKGDIMSENEYTIESVRASLARQEDTIIFGLIERARFPINSPTYNQLNLSIPNFNGSLFDFILNQTEAIQAKTGRYINPEENPYTENLPPSVVPHYNFSKFLHPTTAVININERIKKAYLNDMLPLFVASGDDGNYAQTAATDLSLLQAISRRIHYGKLAAETKFRASPHEYESLIHAQDREGLMKLFTVKSVEEMIQKRVQKKAMVFGQEVSHDYGVSRKYKVDPTIVSRLYKNWIIPLTKVVEVEYLLRRLD